MNIGVITGASSGLGAQYLNALIETYPKLDEIWLIARRKDRLEKLAEEHKEIKIRPIALDLSKDESYYELENLLINENPVIEVLINNAGYEKTGILKTMDKNYVLSMINLNVKGFTMINRVCLPFMKKGSIGIMTCSISSFVPVPKQAVYSASKIYVKYLSEALHAETKKDGINILAMCPGNMDTEMNPKGGTSQSDKVDKLPFLDMKKITRKSIKLAKKGKAIYTPNGLYKLYGFASKVLPTSLMIKIISKSFD